MRSRNENKNTGIPAAVIRLLLLVAAALFLITGIFRKGPTEVKNKAVRICYECIGIG